MNEISGVSVACGVVCVMLVGAGAEAVPPALLHGPAGEARDRPGEPDLLQGEAGAGRCAAALARTSPTTS